MKLFSKSYLELGKVGLFELLIDVLQLLGVKTCLSGIRPEVAQTSIQLGVNFGSISTFSSLKQALLRTGVY